jgi:4-hydroxybenzoyl-CoA thioesterase
MAELVHPVRVEWCDCDPAGILFYGNLFRWMDAASHRLMREIGIAPGTMLPPEMVGFAVAEAHCKFVATAGYYDALELRGHVAEIRKRVVRVDYRLVRPAGDAEPQILATAYEWRIYVHRGTDGVMQSLDIPPSLRAALERFQPDAPGAGPQPG